MTIPPALTTRHLKEFLLAACFLQGLGAGLERLGSLDGVVPVISYLALLALLSGGLVASAYIRSAPLRWTTALLLSASAFFYYAYEKVTSDFLTYDAFINMLNAASFADDAVSQNLRAILIVGVSALILLAALGMESRHRPRVPAWLLAMAPWLAVCLLALVLFVRGGEGARAQPATFTPLAYLALAAYEATADSGPRHDVALPQHGAIPSRDIVLIIDESISGQCDH